MESQNVLVVDDEEAIRDLLSQVFARHGFTVGTAESAEQALEKFKTDRYGVVFLDLNLPGMNGIDLCRHVKDTNPMAIVYAMTGYASLFELSDCREAGFDDYFTKPANLKDLLKAAQDGFEKIARWKTR